MTDDPLVSDPSLLTWTPPQRDLPDVGLHEAVCVDEFYEGYISWDGARDPVHTIRLMWQLLQRRPTGRRFLISKRFNRTLAPGSTLRVWIERWFARPLSLYEEQHGFSLERLIDKPCLLEIGRFTRGEVMLPAVRRLDPWPVGKPPLLSESYARRESVAHWVPKTEEQS